MKTLLGINKAAKVISRLKISNGTIIEDQGDVEKTLAENYVQKLGGKKILSKINKAQCGFVKKKRHSSTCEHGA
jgi:hypothetical protein